MKVLIVNPHMKIGGISASLYNLVDILNKEKSAHEIELFLFNPVLDDKYKDLGNKTKIHSTFLLSCLFINFKQAKDFYNLRRLSVYIIVKAIERIMGTNFLRKLVIHNTLFRMQYDVAISFSNDIPLNYVFLGSNYFVQKVVTAKKKIAWIHNDIDRLGMTRDYILQEYARFDKVVNVSNSCKNRFEELAPEFISKSCLLGNYIDGNSLRIKADEFNPYKDEVQMVKIVTVARIDNQQKRIDRILKISKRLIEKGIEFKWHIIGNGPDLNTLLKEKEILGVNKYVVFEGYQPNPFPYIKNADIFVLTSSYEAQGMVLSESLLLGTPVVTTNFPASLEFVQNEKNGIIAENSTESLFETLLELLNNNSKLKELKQNLSGNDFGSLANDFLLKFEKIIHF